MSRASAPKLPFRKVKVVWLDAYSTDAWENFNPATYPFQEHKVVTDGYLIAQNTEYIAVAGSVGPDPENSDHFDASGIMHIPRGMIVSPKSLRKA